MRFRTEINEAASLEKQFRQKNEKTRAGRDLKL
jgi:hypothetical protein